MKKIIIGRNNACDIVIPDTSDVVSRKQAVLMFSFWGKMILFDTSNNGTYVNGQKLENGKGIRVTRKDKVNFARIVDLDWNEVKNPYQKKWLFCGAGVVFLLLVATLITVLPLWISKDSSTTAKTEITKPMGETFTTVEVQPVNEQSGIQSRKVSKKRKAPRKDTAKDIINKEVNDNSPIVY